MSFVAVMLFAASCGNDAGPVAEPQATATATISSDAEPTSTSAAAPAPAVVTYAADVLPGLGRSVDAQVRDDFLAAYQVYRRELALHRCMAEEDIVYAVQVDYPSLLEPLLGASIDAISGFEPLVTDLERAVENGPVEFTDESAMTVERINLDLSDSIRWNEDQAAELGDRWWLARYGVSLADIDVAGEEGFGREGCEAMYWSAVPSIWDVRNEIRPFIDAYPAAAQEQSFEECREEFRFAAESLGDLEGSGAGFESGVFDECLSRWDTAGRVARQTVEQGEVVVDVEVRFAAEIAEQRQQLADAMVDPHFLALLQALR